MLTAALVCIPFSENILAIMSEAPFITFGWSVKSSVELTNPVNFTHSLILDKSFSQAFFTCETILSAHLSAALYPSSTVKSLPILPLISLPSLLMEI